jgi:hypothetical protein
MLGRRTPLRHIPAFSSPSPMRSYGRLYCGFGRTRLETAIQQLPPFSLSWATILGGWANLTIDCPQLISNGCPFSLSRSRVIYVFTLSLQGNRIAGAITACAETARAHTLAPTPPVNSLACRRCMNTRTEVDLSHEGPSVMKDIVDDAISRKSACAHEGRGRGSGGSEYSSTCAASKQGQFSSQPKQNAVLPDTCTRHTACARLQLGRASEPILLVSRIRRLGLLACGSS